MGNPGVSGFGGDAYEENRSESGQPAQSDSAGSQQSNGGGRDGAPDEGGAFADTRPDSQAEAAEEVTLDFDYDEEVPGFEASASDCLNRALRIARSLNHMNLSADHLMLALTMDPNARRLIERIGDIVQLREAAMQRLGRCTAVSPRATPSRHRHRTSWTFARQRGRPRRSASSWSPISDLINAFPQANGRLTYGAGDGSKAITLMEKIEQGLVPPWPTP